MFVLCVLLYVDYVVLGVVGLNVFGGVEYSVVCNVNEEGIVCVLLWFVFNFGVCYMMKIGGYCMVLCVLVDNLFNKFYWCDVGE